MNASPRSRPRHPRCFRPALEMKPEQRLGIAFGGVAHRGVSAAAGIARLRPGDRVVGAHLPAGIGRLIERCQDVDCSAGVAAEIVPFVGALPDCRQAFCRRVARILDADRLALDLGMAREIGADELAVPGPLILRIGRRVYANEPPARSSVRRRPPGSRREVFPVVLRNTTTLYRASSASVKRAASSVLSVAKPCSAPSALIAAIACGIESWRKPVDLEKTRAAKRGRLFSASAWRIDGASNTLNTITSE